MFIILLAGLTYTIHSPRMCVLEAEVTMMEILENNTHAKTYRCLAKYVIWTICGRENCKQIMN